MTSKTILSFCMILCVSLLFAAGGANLTFLNGTHDFGTIAEGPDVSHEFEFTNKGSAPLIIKSVKPSCGCTTPEWPEAPIMPGKSSVIKVIYETEGRPGSFNKTITVSTNDPVEPIKVINIIGNVTAKE